MLGPADDQLCPDGNAGRARRSKSAHAEVVVVQVLEIVGAFLILLGFVGAQTHRWRPDDYTYLLLNFVGSAVLAGVAFEGYRWGFLLLEGVWALISLGGLWTRRRDERRV